ncbi:MAG: 2,3-bisphosphoglycerate-independent phosphoglycerate mutase [Thermoplasmata archaeon]|nr:MAG: 2,3-bisphosphoglycerate-independent phosphoglycerate mutase [Thermoplasmata archaeon]
MKAILLVLDGVADRPVRELDYRTPLEVAHTPNLDEFARLGINGILDPIAPGIRAGSDTSHLSILGYDPYEVYTGRGPFEAAGVGIELKEGDIALRANFATVDEKGIIRDRRAGRISEGTSELARALNKIEIEGVEIIFKESVAHRAVLVLRGKNLSYKVSDSDPHEIGRPIKKIIPLDNSFEAKRTAEILNEFSKQARNILEKHEINKRRILEGKPPANAILLRGAGKTPKLEKFKLNSACLATTAIINGIGRLVGMEVVQTKREYGDRVKQALEILKRKEFILMNIKEADEAGHDRDYNKKIKIIEEIDEAVESLRDFITENYLIVLADHTTPVSVGDHTGDTVPVLICGPEVRRDGVSHFDERSCVSGGLGRIRGRDIMPILFDLLGKSEKFGA